MVNIVAMLQNQETKRYHPIVFRMAPLPGCTGSESSQRYKSHGHHTEGFDDRAQAIAFAEKEYIPMLFGARTAFGGDILWDGKDVPALSIFFGTVNGELRPLF